MEKEMNCLFDSITETQDVKFIFDKSCNLKGLDEIDLNKYNKAILICDEGLINNDLFLNVKKKLYEKIKFDDIIFIEASESKKSVNGYVDLVNNFSKFNCSKDDVIIAIGGGTILDLVAFFTSTYMRGVDLLMVPTTIIGMVDASTGGKTCVNTSYGRNILGTLFMPRYVYNNINFLKTNSNYHLRQGFSEIFKYSLLKSKELLNMLLKYNKEPNDNLLLEIVERTAKIRLTIRKKHQFVSNFGHTFGQAIEKISNFSISHGDAISIGIILALSFSIERNIIDKELKEKIINYMKELKLTTNTSKKIDVNDLVEMMSKDKKCSGKKIRLVLIEDIGKTWERKGKLFYECNKEEIKDFLERSLKNVVY